MKQFLKAAAIGLAVTVSAASLVRAETLADTLVSAYNHSGLLDQNRAVLRAADEDVALGVANLRPILNWTADISRTFGRSDTGFNNSGIADTQANLSITATLLLYDFGASRFQLDAAKESVLATRQALLSVEQDVLLRAVEAYMEVRRNSRFVSLRENNLRLIEQELRAARDRFEVGEVTRTDVALAESAFAGARSGLANSQGNLAQAIEEFRAAVGRKPGNLQVPSTLPKLLADVEQAKAIAVRKHPDMIQAQHDIAAAELNILATEAAIRPTISLQGALNASDNLGEDEAGQSATYGIVLSGPIYQGGALSSNTRRAIAQRDSLRAQLHLVRLRVQQNVGDAYAALRASQASVIASRQEVRAARVAFDGVREEATLGARTTLDVLDAEQDLLDAEANLISAQVDSQIAAYSVLSAMGELTVKDLRLNVQTYDPTAYYNLVKDAPVPSSRQGQKLDRVLEALGKQ